MIDELHEKQRKIDHIDRIIRRTGTITGGNIK
jgi:hypothetical protein